MTKLRGEGSERTSEPVRTGASYRHYTARGREYVRNLRVIALEVPPRITNPVGSEVVLWEPTHPRGACR